MLKAISVLGWLLKIIILQESSFVEANWNLKASLRITIIGVVIL